MATEMDVQQTYVDKAIMAVNSGTLTAAEAAGAKWWATETQWRIIDRCLQLHGGYGYVNEYDIARSPACGAMPASNASTAAPTRSCSTSSGVAWAFDHGNGDQVIARDR